MKHLAAILVWLALAPAFIASGQEIASVQFVPYCPNGQCPTPQRNYPQATRPETQRAGQVNPLTPSIKAAIVRVSGSDGSVGTGSVIASDEAHVWVVTAFHVTANGIGSPFAIQFNNDDGRQLSARYLGGDKAADVALLEANGRCNAQPLPVGDIALGEPVAMSGYAQGQNFGVYRGWFTSVWGSTGLYVDGCRVISGCSGGPVFNARHEVCGIVTGQSVNAAENYSTCGCGPGPLRRLLARLLPRNWSSQPPRSPNPRNPFPQSPQPSPYSPQVEIGGKPGCECDNSQLVAAIESLKVQIANLQQQSGPAGERGEQGPRGPQGERGPAGPPGKEGGDAISRSLPITIVRPNGTRQRLVVPLDNEHELVLNLFEQGVK